MAMAAWQFDFQLIPRQSSNDNILWSAENVTESLKERIKSILPLGKTWAQNIELYGESETSCVTILHTEGDRMEIAVRLDVRQLTKKFLVDFVNIAHEMDGVFLVLQNGKRLDPDPVTLAAEIRKSPSYRFVTNPREFLASLSQST